MNSNVYIASPFFTPTEIEVRDAMLAKVASEISESYFRPDETQASKSYSGSPGEELGRTIFEENIEHIRKCDILCFPLGTRDVGTLFEVGVALKLDKPIYGYKWKPEDELRRLLTVNKRSIPTFERSTLIQVETLSSAVVLGYNFDTEYRTYYVLGEGMRDNLMLRFMGKRVKFIGKGNFQVEDFDIGEAA
jgi:nucleoside 2-deoxyribosyltransferase